MEFFKGEYTACGGRSRSTMEASAAGIRDRNIKRPGAEGLSNFSAHARVSFSPSHTRGVHARYATDERIPASTPSSIIDSYNDMRCVP